MNRGGIGYIELGRLVLPQTLLQPLAIRDENRVDALYYPTPKGQQYRNAPKVHDFQITPVPHRYWHVVGTLVVRLQHKAGTLAPIVEYLAERRIGINMVECSRAAHRYATWNLTVVFEDLLKDAANTFDAHRSIYNKTYNRLLKLARDLRRQYMHCLYRDINDPTLARGVEAYPTHTLAYYHNAWRQNMKRRKRNNPQWLWEPFALNAQSGGVLHSVNDQFYSILDHLSRLERGRLLPSCVFAEVDSFDKNMRVEAIPKLDICGLRILEHAQAH